MPLNFRNEFIDQYLLVDVFKPVIMLRDELDHATAFFNQIGLP